MPSSPEYYRAYYAANADRMRARAAANRANPLNKIERTCATCAKVFFVPKSEMAKGHGIYCSRSCRPAWNTGVTGMQPWMNTSGLRNGHSATQFKPGDVPWCKANSDKMPRGQQHQNWKGGVSRAYKTGYYSVEYKQWRTAVFERDGYACLACGACGYLTAHHIKSFACYSELRFDIANGQTLCESCHAKTDNYKGRAKRRGEWQG